MGIYKGGQEALGRRTGSSAAAASTGPSKYISASFHLPLYSFQPFFSIKPFLFRLHAYSSPYPYVSVPKPISIKS